MADIGIRVWPATEEIRKHVKHANGVRFAETVGESVEWPNDTFTFRRIRDGDVLTEAPVAKAQAPAHSDDVPVSKSHTSSHHEEKKTSPKTT
jgi:hypothetical protein